MEKELILNSKTIWITSFCDNYLEAEGYILRTKNPENQNECYISDETDSGFFLEQLNILYE
jgi:hypothetical protein